MKEIESSGYNHLIKQGIGEPRDPGLPWDYTERTLSMDSGGEDISSGRSGIKGYSEVQWGGHDIGIYYQFDYDPYETVPANHIRQIRLVDSVTKQPIADVEDDLIEIFDKQIREDIESQIENM